MSRPLYLLAALCMLSTTLAQKDFLSIAPIAHSPDFEVGEYENEEANWENEECNWEYETELDLNVADFDIATFGKAIEVDSSNLSGNNAEEIGTAVENGVVNIVSAMTDGASKPPSISTGNTGADNFLNGAAEAVASLANDLNTAAQSVGDGLGDVVTDSINGVHHTNDINGAIEGAVSQAAVDMGNNAEQIGNSVGTATVNAVSAIIASNPNDAQRNEALQNLTQAGDQISNIVSSLAANAGANADTIGAATGTAIGDAIIQGDNAADAAGDAMANMIQTAKDNAESIGNTVGNAMSDGLSGAPDTTQEDLDRVKAETSQSVRDSLENITQGTIEETKEDVSRGVADAINTVQAQGNDANKDVVGVINAVAAQIIAQGKPPGN